MSRNLLIFLVFLMLVPTLCNAEAFEFRCTVFTELNLDDDGALRPYRTPLDIGKTFGIDREKGIIVNSPLKNLTASEVIVLSQDRYKTSYQLLSLAAPSGELGKATTDFLVILEWTKYKNKKKPFVAVTSIGTVYSGMCE